MHVVIKFGGHASCFCVVPVSCGCAHLGSAVAREVFFVVLHSFTHTHAYLQQHTYFSPLSLSVSPEYLRIRTKTHTVSESEHSACPGSPLRRGRQPLLAGLERRNHDGTARRHLGQARPDARQQRARPLAPSDAHEHRGGRARRAPARRPCCARCECAPPA